VPAGVILCGAFDKPSAVVTETSRDPLILGGVTVLLTAVAAVACLTPASRARRSIRWRGCSASCGGGLHSEGSEPNDPIVVAAGVIRSAADPFGGPPVVCITRHCA